MAAFLSTTNSKPSALMSLTKPDGASSSSSPSSLCRRDAATQEEEEEIGEEEDDGQAWSGLAYGPVSMYRPNGPSVAEARHQN
uniref:Uncharacterized protein n=1 Tax=Oryza meridionalis TaxID=40149 RepID=A0A0E0EC15_9ORYZ